MANKLPALLQFETLEDGILILSKRAFDARYRKKFGRINLARYDGEPVLQLSKQIRNGLGFTFHQQIFAIKLITKYAKQWKKVGFDVSNINKETPTAYPMREVDRRRIADVDESQNIMTLQFLYHKQIITSLFMYRDSRSAGLVQYNKESKNWEIAISHENIEFIATVATTFNFEQTEKFKKLIESTDRGIPEIFLDLDGESDLIIHNAPPSLASWITTKIGTLSLSNLIPLATHSEHLGITLSQSVINKIMRDYDFSDLLLSRISFFDSSEVDFLTVIESVSKIAQDRIVIYTNKIDTMAGIVRSVFPDHSVFDHVKSKEMPDVIPDKAVFLTDKILPFVPDVFVICQGFFIGTSRRSWFDAAPKNIYYCEDINNLVQKAIKKNEKKISLHRQKALESERELAHGSEETEPKMSITL